MKRAKLLGKWRNFPRRKFFSVNFQGVANSFLQKRRNFPRLKFYLTKIFPFYKIATLKCYQVLTELNSLGYFQGWKTKVEFFHEKMSILLLVFQIMKMLKVFINENISSFGSVVLFEASLRKVGLWNLFIWVNVLVYEILSQNQVKWNNFHIFVWMNTIQSKKNQKNIFSTSKFNLNEKNVILSSV